MDKKTKITIFIIILIIAIIVGLVSMNLSLNTLPLTGDEQDSIIFDFDTCVSAGYPILESDPAQCKTPDGRTFVQEETQIANPASEYCIENGGRLEIRQDLEGEAGFCIFEDGSECEEWAYFNGECQPGR